ncbi:MAG TPA: recombinase family protein [Clostridiales bacterium]|nr:recombinase family protein [Clostridiales bacterium]
MSEHKLTEGNLALKEKHVIVIGTAERPQAQQLRVAAYARVSSDSTDQLNSFVAQVNYYTTLIAGKENWTLADIYADEGITGTSAAKREDFQRLLSDCRKGRIDKILVKSISRFARNTKDCLETIRALKSIGVAVYFEEQNIDTSAMSGELLTAVFASLAQAESESISKNMRWSYKQRMGNGTYIPPTLAYGYVLKDKKVVIDENRASVIRRIVTEYLNGANSDDIAVRLTADGVPCRYGGTKWNSTSVRYILTNEKYTGNSLWQKYYTTDTLPYQHPRNRGEKESYFAENTHPAIITTAEYEAVQALMEKRRQMLSPAQNIPYPFRQKVYCGNCGTVFRRKVVRGIIYWVCMNHEQQGSGCDMTQIPEREIQAAFLRLYHKLKKRGGSILTQLIADLQTIRNRKMLWSIDIIELNKRISELSDQNRMLTDMNKVGLVDSDIFISRTNELAGQIRAAKQEKERIIGSDNDDTIQRTREVIELLEASPDFMPDFDGEIFSDLVECITAISNDKLRFRLKNWLEIDEPIERTVR